MDMKIRIFPLVGIACIALSGCGVVNSVIPEVDNLVSLNDTTVDAVVGSGRALISGNITKSATFDDRTLPSQGSIRRLRLRQSLDQAVEVTVPNGATLPASFTLSNFALLITLADAAHTVTASATYPGPATFTRQGTTSTYVTTSTVEVKNITFSSTDFTIAQDIITAPPSPNTATGRLSFDANDTELPRNSVLRFKFVNGKAKVEL
jgi:hypothetical protein